MCLTAEILARYKLLVASNYPRTKEPFYMEGFAHLCNFSQSLRNLGILQHEISDISLQLFRGNAIVISVRMRHIRISHFPHFRTNVPRLCRHLEDVSHNSSRGNFVLSTWHYPRQFSCHIIFGKIPSCLFPLFTLKRAFLIPGFLAFLIFIIHWRTKNTLSSRRY